MCFADVTEDVHGLSFVPSPPDVNHHKGKGRTEEEDVFRERGHGKKEASSEEEHKEEIGSSTAERIDLK